MLLRAGIGRIMLSVALLVLASLVRAQSDGVVQASGNRSISIELPASAFASEVASLSVDIDGYDVSDFGSLSGQTLEVALDTPLDVGEHALTVYLFLADGDAEVLLDTLLEIPAGDGTQWSINSTLQTDYRMDQSPDADFQGVGRSSSAAGLSLQAEKAYSNWRLAADLETIYDTENEISTGGDRWLLPGYSMSAAYQGDKITSAALAGNVTVTREDLLFSGYRRRGAAVETAATSGRLQLQMFSVSPTPRNSFDGNYVYPGNSNHRSSGVSGSIIMLDDHLQIGAGFVDGKTSLGGAGVSSLNDFAVYGGDSWNVTLDSYWMNDSLWLHVERAESKFDADGIGIGLPASSDDATQAMLQLSSDGDLGYGVFDYWSAYFQFQRIGLGFYSLGNMSLPGNLDIRSAYFQGGFKNLSLDLEVTQEQTNPEDDPLLPTQTLDRAGVNLAYTPAALDPDDKLWQRLGAPSLNSWLYRTDNSQPAADAAIAGYDVDNRTDELGVALTFSREQLSWSLQYDIVDYDDSSEQVFDGGFLIYEPPSDSRNRQTSLQASWAPGERVALDAVLQWNNLEESDFGDEYRTTSYALSGTFVLVPEKLSLFMSLSQGQDRNSFGDPQFAAEKLRSRYASMQLSWAALEANDDHPGLDLYLKSGWARNDDLVFMSDTEFWSIYLGAAVRWTGSKQ